jgi:hypothetical protein
LPSSGAEIGGSDDGDAHTRIASSTNFGVGFRSLLDLQQDLGFCAEETIRRCHKWRKVAADVARGGPRGVSSSLVHQLLTLRPGLWTGWTWHRHPLSEH